MVRRFTLRSRHRRARADVIPRPQLVRHSPIRPPPMCGSDIRGRVRCESAPCECRIAHRARFQHSILEYTLRLYNCIVPPHLIDAIFHERRWADGQSCRDVLIETVRGAGTAPGCNYSSRRSNSQRHHLAAQGRNAALGLPALKGGQFSSNFSRRIFGPGEDPEIARVRGTSRPSRAFVLSSRRSEVGRYRAGPDFEQIVRRRTAACQA